MGGRSEARSEWQPCSCAVTTFVAIFNGTASQELITDIKCRKGGAKEGQ